ncbi:endonuclease domain-containing protein [Devosia sp. ZB163]|uniref:endonuclease domain-containing protein n=1 Tax=Devosia sp. ZB163 TaxID=3025938 RepID=UPI0023603922|nr:endonuclease domain-containing protein [Devosia sp. ZB163]MDC9822589.1 endonuclease domain-containing protein [Devosia sp. ZB163]
MILHRKAGEGDHAKRGGGGGQMRGPTITLKHAKRLRREMTLPEVVLWQDLRRRQLSKHFRRQHPVGPHVLDFYCSGANVAVEVDGAAHDFVQQALHDERRDAWLSQQGVRVLRFAAAEILDDRSIEGVLTAIRLALTGAE